MTTAFQYQEKLASPVSPEELDSSTSENFVEGIVDQLTSTMKVAVKEIRKIHLHSHFLSVNAAIEAERADKKGATFSEVAKEVQRLSSNTEHLADELEARTNKSIDLVRTMANKLSGTRLADIALNSMDLIDRNLYERTCDVRWWATDSSLVDALQAPSQGAIEHACERLGVILDAYTVYFDIVLCDNSGTIVANGRPKAYQSIGLNRSTDHWFKKALATRNGSEFAFEFDQKCSLVGNRASLVYSAAVRKGGKSNGESLGVLGIIFNWTDLATAVLENESLSMQESARTLRLILDENANVIASSRRLPSDYQIPMAEISPMLQQSKGYGNLLLDREPVCIAHAKSPGFETYSTGWHAILIQELS